MRVKEIAATEPDKTARGDRSRETLGPLPIMSDALGSDQGPPTRWLQVPPGRHRVWTPRELLLPGGPPRHRRRVRSPGKRSRRGRRCHRDPLRYCQRRQPARGTCGDTSRAPAIAANPKPASCVALRSRLRLRLRPRIRRYSRSIGSWPCWARPPNASAENVGSRARPETTDVRHWPCANCRAGRSCSTALAAARPKT